MRTTLLAVVSLDFNAGPRIESKIASQIIHVTGIGGIPSFKFTPNELEGFYVVPHGRSVAFGTLNCKHARFIKHKTYFVSGICNHAEFGELGFEPS